MTTDLSWEKALRVWGFAVTPEVKAGGWPEFFATGHLARLQYPVEGTDAEKSRARKNQCAIEAAMTRGIAAGELEAEAHSRTVTVKDGSRLRRRIAPSRYGISRGWYERDRPPSPPPRPPQQKTETWHTVTRAAFRDWLARQGEEPSEHIRAWLRPLEQAETRQKEAEPAKPKKKESQQERVEACLVECERRASELHQPFDRWNMPGQKAQFIALLRRFDPAFTKLAPSTLSDYVKEARCRWSEGANANEDATELFNKLFPVPARRGGGVVPLQRREA